MIIYIFEAKFFLTFFIYNASATQILAELKLANTKEEVIITTKKEDDQEPDTNFKLLAQIQFAKILPILTNSILVELG